MAKSKKVTRALVNKELARIRNIVREAEKEGYIFNNVIPKNVAVTKSTLQRLRGISREDLLNTARRINVETGEILPTQAEKNIEARKKRKETKILERNRKQRHKEKIKPVRVEDFDYSIDEYVTPNGTYTSDDVTPFSEVVIENFKRMFTHFPVEMKDRIYNLLEQLITQQGKEDCAISIYSLGGGLISQLVAQGYDSDSIIEELGQALISNLPNATDSYKYDIADMFEAHETGFTLED